MHTIERRNGVEYQSVEHTKKQKRAYVFWDSKTRSIRSAISNNISKCSNLDWCLKKSSQSVKITANCAYVLINIHQSMNGRPFSILINEIENRFLCKPSRYTIRWMNLRVYNANVLACGLRFGSSLAIIACMFNSIEKQSNESIYFPQGNLPFVLDWISTTARFSLLAENPTFRWTMWPI